MAWVDAEEGGQWVDAEAPAVKPTVTPGDVEGRKRQVAAQAQAEGPNQVRERLGVGSELVGGIRDTFGGLGDMLTGRGYVPEELSVGGVLQTSPVRTAMGALRTVGAPLAPLSNMAAKGGETISDALTALGFNTAADVAGAVGEAAANVLAPGAIIKSAKAIAPVAKTKFASGRTKAAEASQRAGEEIMSLKAGQEAADESILSFAEAAKRQVPKAADIRDRLAKNAPLGEDVGKGFQSTYNKSREATSKGFKERYAALEEGADRVPASADNYLASIEKTLGEKGISRPLPTRAEKAAGVAKSAFDIDDEAVEQVEALSKQVKMAADPASKKFAQEALDEYIAASEIGENPTLAQLMRERQRLAAGERAAYRIKDDNLVRQFKGLRSGLDEDIKAIAPDKYDELQAISKDYLEKYVPYYGNRSPVRAIAEGSPERVVDDIIRPVSDKKAVEKVTRSFQLITDPKQREAVRKAFLNKGVEDAFKDGVFKPERFTAWWDRYANPTGNNNKVLRTALGPAYTDAEGIINTLKTVKTKSIDEFAQETVSNMAKSTAVKEKAVVSKLKADIEKFMGPEVGNTAGALMGQMAIFQAAPSVLTGNFLSAGVKLAAGGGIMMSRPVMQRFLEFKRGRSLIKAALRTAPGTTKAMAQARLIKDLANRIGMQDGQDN